MIILSEIFIEDKLPDPLSIEQSNQLFDEMHKGNMKARNEIITRNIRIVINHVLNNFKDSLYEKSELVSIGLVALIKAVDTYDNNRNVIFYSYALKCIRNEILSYIRKNKKLSSNISLDSYFYDNGNDKKVPYINSLISDFDNVENIAINNELNKLLSQKINELDDIEKEVLNLYYNLDYTQRQIGEILNVSYSTINNMLKRILKKLKKSFYKSKIKTYSI